MEKINWKEHVASWTYSGISRKKYCEENRLSYHSFLYHLNQLNELSEAGFSQVRITNPETHDKIDYHFADGRIVCVLVNALKEMIRFILFL